MMRREKKRKEKKKRDEGSREEKSSKKNVHIFSNLDKYLDTAKLIAQIFLIYPDHSDKNKNLGINTNMTYMIELKVIIQNKKNYNLD